MKRWPILLVALAALALPTSASAGGGMAPDELATCSVLETGSFRWGALKNPRGAERGRDRFAAELRQEIALDRLLPKHGWFVLSRSSKRVVFAQGGLLSLSAASFLRRSNGRVELEGWGARIGCLPRRVTTAGSAGVLWNVLPTAPPVDTTATKLRMAVDTYRCGADTGVERVSVDRVKYRRGTIDILLDEKPGPACEHPIYDPTVIDIQLAQPIGDRVLRDASVIPSVDRFTPAQRRAIIRGASPLTTIVLGSRFTTFCRTSIPILTEAEFKQIETRWYNRAEKCKLGTEAAPRF